MAFPSSPTNGQTYTTGGVTYVFNSTKGVWQIQTYDTVDAAGALTSIKTVDGASSGLDADLLDGLTSSQFLRSDTNDTFNGILNINRVNTTSTINHVGSSHLVLDNSGSQTKILFRASSTNKGLIRVDSSGNMVLSAGSNAFYWNYDSDGVGPDTGGRFRNSAGSDWLTWSGTSVNFPGSINVGAITVGGSALEAGAKEGIFWENDTTITASYTITSGKNAMTAGPVTINNGVTVTIPDGSTWTVV